MALGRWVGWIWGRLGMGQHVGTRNRTAGFSRWFHLPGQAILGTHSWPTPIWVCLFSLLCVLQGAPEGNQPRETTRNLDRGSFHLTYHGGDLDGKVLGPVDWAGWDCLGGIA